MNNFDALHEVAAQQRSYYIVQKHTEYERQYIHLQERLREWEEKHYVVIKSYDIGDSAFVRLKAALPKWSYAHTNVAKTGIEIYGKADWN